MASYHINITAPTKSEGPQELGTTRAYQWAIHHCVASDGREQPHVHLMFSGRQLDGIEREPELFFTYDANGNASTRNGYTIGWTSYNYPTSFTTATESAVYSYGPDRQRWKETYTNSSGVETTYYAGKLFEVANFGGLAHYRHYIYAGSELVAIDDRTTVAETLNYIVSDHQGSYSSIQTGASPATNLVSESFTAFGNRRSGETWSGAPTTGDETNINNTTRRGYTGESVIGNSMGLNHLNGRVEDAITGRFLSADPMGIDPSNTQSFNRYTYVHNNPLTLVDTSGFRAGNNANPGLCYLNCPGDYHTLWSGEGVTGGSFGGDGGSGYLADLTASLDNTTNEIGNEAAATVASNFSGSDFGSGANLAFNDPVINGDSTASGTTAGGTVASDAAGSGTTTPSSGAAQSGVAQQSGCTGSPCLDEITVQAARSPLAAAMYQFGDTQTGTVACGGLSCTYNATPYLWNGALAGIEFRLKYPGKPGFWVQTYQNFGPSIDGTVGSGVVTPDCAPCANDYTSGNMYWDQPGGQSIFVATTTLVQLSSSLNAIPAFTIQWGFEATLGGGLNSVLIIPPAPIAPSLLGWHP